jgi:putative colanic acid biosynthesis acetyltransferase WcaF
MNSTDLSKFNNDWFDIGRNKIVVLLWYIINAVVFNSYLLPVSAIKRVILRFFGAKIGKGVVLKPKLNIKYPWKLHVGNHTWIGENVWIDNLDVVEIGNHVCISQGALILSGNHDYSAVSFELIVKPIKIEDGVWIGAKSIVTQGVICRNHSVLGVDSVACDDMEEYSVYKGNPAVKIRDRHIV